MSASYIVSVLSYQHFLSLLIKLVREDDLDLILFCKNITALPESQTIMDLYHLSLFTIWSSLVSWSPWLGSTDSCTPPPAVHVLVMRELLWSSLEIFTFYSLEDGRCGLWFPLQKFIFNI